MAYLNYDLEDAQVNAGPSPLPEGCYEAAITESKPVDSDGKECEQPDYIARIDLVWGIIGGEHEGRRVYDRIMVRGSDKAVRFGRDKLKKILTLGRYANPNNLRDTDDLVILAPLFLELYQEEYQGKVRNSIREYHASDNGLMVPLKEFLARRPAQPAYQQPPAQQPAYQQAPPPQPPAQQPYQQAPPQQAYQQPYQQPPAQQAAYQQPPAQQPAYQQAPPPQQQAYQQPQGQARPELPPSPGQRTPYDGPPAGNPPF
jgi:hypothetical protein